MNVKPHTIRFGVLRAFACALVTAIAAITAASPSFAQAQNCNQAQGPGCLYLPAASYGFTPFERSVFYADNAGQPREVKLLIRQPLGAPLPMPVVIWSHGGTEGKRDAATSMAEWSELSARRVLQRQHRLRAPRRSESHPGCASRSAWTRRPAGSSAHLNWDRPHDIVRAGRTRSSGGNANSCAARSTRARWRSAAIRPAAAAPRTVAGAKRNFVGTGRFVGSATHRVSPIAPATRQLWFLRHNFSMLSIRGSTSSARSHGYRTATTAATPCPTPGICTGDTPFGRRIGFQRMPANGNKYHHTSTTPMRSTCCSS
jgi:hypothetical protein